MFQLSNLNLLFGQVLELTNGLIANNLTDIELNYQSLVVHVTEMVQALMDLQQNFTGPIFPDLVSAYNLTALNFRYQAAFERFMQQDITEYVDLKNILEYTISWVEHFELSDRSSLFIFKYQIL